MSTILNARDVEFLLYEWLHAEELTDWPYFAEHDRNTFDAMLDLSQDIATRHFRPHNRAGDLHPPHMGALTGTETAVEILPEVSTALQHFNESGLLASTLPNSIGGYQLPQVISRACFTWFQAANISTSSFPMLTIGNLNLLLAHGTPAQQERFAHPQIEGRFTGTMAMSEPQAGSSLTDLTTRAELDTDATSAHATFDADLGPRYRIKGTKMWISAGEHQLSENIVHLVLAKAPGAPAGAGGLSLFIVPKYLVHADGSLGERNDVVLAGLNHKMGYRGVTNTLLNFGEGTFTPEGKAGAIGYLVGEEHHGLKYMFHMMNEARIGVGAGAVALGYTAYLEALQYAKNRPQGRPISNKNPTDPQVMIVEHADVKRMLLAAKSYAEGGLALVLYAAKVLDFSEHHPDEQVRDEQHRLLEVLTPIVKSWPSQWSQAGIDNAIQIHGGAGYTQDYNVEQYYRDNRLNPIHEGTHAIHGLDLLGRKAILNRGADLELLLSRIAATAASIPASNTLQTGWATTLQELVERIRATTANLWAQGNPDVALANATAYLEALGHLVVAWLWLEQAHVAATADEETHPDHAFYQGKLAAATYFFTYEVPKISTYLEILETDQTFLPTLDPECL